MSTKLQFKLQYFNLKGRAEVSRVMLKIRGIDFEDARFAPPEFATAKASGELSVNMDRVPLMTVGDVTFGQSMAIERFVAKRANLIGSNDIEAAQIDCLVEHVRDIKEKYLKIRFIADPAEKETAMAAWYSKELGEWLVKLEKSLPRKRTQGFSVGSAVSYAEVSIWHLLMDYLDDKAAAEAASAETPALRAICQTIAALPAVQTWLAERPQTPF